MHKTWHLCEGIFCPLRYDRHGATQQCVHPTGGSLRVFKPFSRLEAGSVKMASSRPAHPPVTQTVRRLAKRVGSKVLVAAVWIPQNKPACYNQ
jgi:hypothetical protein